MLGSLPHLEPVLKVLNARFQVKYGYTRRLLYCNKEVILYKVNSQAESISTISTAHHIPTLPISLTRNTRSRTRKRDTNKKECIVPATHSYIEYATDDIFGVL
jgi:hypothetical protein